MDSKETEGLARKLECPICFELPPGDVFNCQAGHSICSKCTRQLVNCALCQKPMTTSRNFVVESLIEDYKERLYSNTTKETNGNDISSDLQDKLNLLQSKICCSNKSDGCEKTFNPDQYRKLEAHQRNCEFNPVACFVKSDGICKSRKIPISEYLNHLISIHKIRGEMSEYVGQLYKIDRTFVGLHINTDWPPYHFEFDGQKFLRFSRVRNRVISWWIKLIGPDELASTYTARLMIESRRNQPDGLMKEWVVSVYPLRTSDDVIHSEPGYPAKIKLGSEAMPAALKYEETYKNRSVTHSWGCRIVMATNRININDY